MEWRVPLSDIDFGPEETAAVQEVMSSRWLTMGSITQEFEQEFAAYAHAKHAIAVTNATAALHLACLALGIRSGDEVIVPSMTFVATANAVRYVGAVPVFADIGNEDDLNIDAESILENITSRTKAIIVVHYAGYACDMPRILEIARKNSLAVIEDAAHAPGAHLENRMLGTWGQIGCFSFFSNKNMTTGEGGMLVTDDDELAAKLRLLRSHGMTSLTLDRHQGHAFTYDVTELGYNYRIDEIRSAIGRVQLKKLDQNNTRRKVLTDLYRECIAEIAPDICIPFSKSQGESSCHILPAILPPDIDRQNFMAEMKKQGIQTSIHYPPVHQFQAYRNRNFPHLSLEKTENLAAREVTLPLYPALKEDQVLMIARAAAAAFGKSKLK